MYTYIYIYTHIYIYIYMYIHFVGIILLGRLGVALMRSNMAWHAVIWGPSLTARASCFLV